MKKVTILFGEAHLAYSPTVIGLHDLLSQHFDVTIIARNPKYFNDKPLPNRKVVYITEKPNRAHNYLSRIFAELISLLNKDIALLRVKGLRHGLARELNFIRTFLKNEAPDFIIAVDFKNLLFTQLLEKRVEFLSLEIKENDKFYDNCDLQNINSVIIQSRERYDHLFKGEQFTTFIIQNAPIYSASQVNSRRTGLVYSGTAWNAFGFYHILEFLEDSPVDTLTVKGAVFKQDRVLIESKYGDLLTTGRLVIDDEYVDNRQIVDYLREFRIGFCFYNFEIDSVNTFNYTSAPSGKMFNYFAAGVPVIGIDIPGLQPVREFDCGILIKDMQPESIKNAIVEIESRFDYYSENCLRAAAHFSFDKMAEPFLDYLTHRPTKRDD